MRFKKLLAGVCTGALLASMAVMPAVAETTTQQALTYTVSIAGNDSYWNTVGLDTATLLGDSGVDASDVTAITVKSECSKIGIYYSDTSMNWSAVYSEDGEVTLDVGDMYNGDLTCTGWDGSFGIINNTNDTTAYDFYVYISYEAEVEEDTTTETVIGEYTLSSNSSSDYIILSYDEMSVYDSIVFTFTVSADAWDNGCVGYNYNGNWTSQGWDFAGGSDDIVITVNAGDFDGDIQLQTWWVDQTATVTVVGITSSTDDADDDSTTTADDDSTTADDDSTTADDDSTTADDDSTTADDDSTTADDDSTTADDDSTTADDDSTTADDDSTTAADDSTTTVATTTEVEGISYNSSYVVSSADYTDQDYKSATIHIDGLNYNDESYAAYWNDYCALKVAVTVDGVTTYYAVVGSAVTWDITVNDMGTDDKDDDIIIPIADCIVLDTTNGTDIVVSIDGDEWTIEVTALGWDGAADTAYASASVTLSTDAVASEEAATSSNNDAGEDGDATSAAYLLVLVALAGVALAGVKKYQA